MFNSFFYYHCDRFWVKWFLTSMVIESEASLSVSFNSFSSIERCLFLSMGLSLPLFKIIYFFVAHMIETIEFYNVKMTGNRKEGESI